MMNEEEEFESLLLDKEAIRLLEKEIYAEDTEIVETIEEHVEEKINALEYVENNESLIDVIKSSSKKDQPLIE